MDENTNSHQERNGVYMRAQETIRRTRTMEADDSYHLHNSHMINSIEVINKNVNGISSINRADSRRSVQTSLRRCRSLEGNHDECGR